MITQREFDSLFRANYSQLFYFARQWVKDEEMCRDIVASAFECLWIKAEESHMDQARSYIYKVVHGKCIDHLRHQNHVEAYIQYATAMGDAYISSNEYELQAERESLLQQCLRLLKPPADEIFRKVFDEGKKYKEVAEELGFSLSLVQKHMARALDLIRKNVKT